MKEAYFGTNSNPSFKAKLDALVELYEDSTFRAVGTELGRLYAEGSGHKAYEYVFSHKMTGSLYNLLITPIWQLLPKVHRQYPHIDLGLRLILPA